MALKLNFKKIVSGIKFVVAAVLERIARKKAE